MKELVFITGNKDKFNEASAILPWKVNYLDLEVEEVQDDDLNHVAERKVEEAFGKIGKPVFVDDVGVSFLAWNNFPGPYAKHFLKAFGNKKITEMINKEDDKTVQTSCVIAYHDGKNIHTFRGDVVGLVAPEPRGEDGWGFDFIVIPAGYNKTFAELGQETKNKISHRAIALSKFKKFLDEQEI